MKWSAMTGRILSVIVPEMETVVQFEHTSDTVKVTMADKSVHFLIVYGKPLTESVAWYGPIVMNTQEELKKYLTNKSGGPSSKDSPSDRSQGPVHIKLRSYALERMIRFGQAVS